MRSFLHFFRRRSAIPEAAPIALQGRPPARVLLALTVTALTLHGCLLEGVPLEPPSMPAGTELMLPATPVRVRSLPASPSPLAGDVPAAGIPLAAIGLAPGQPSRPVAPPDARAKAPSWRLAAVDARLATEPPADPADAAVSPSSIPQASAPLAAQASAAALRASEVRTLSPAVVAPTPTDLVVLRHPEGAVPVYRTRIPPATTLVYDIRRGGIAGDGELSWRPEGDHYEARLHASVIGYTLLTQISQGGFDKAGLAPLRFTDQRARKAARAANFQRDVGKITFSGPRDEFALPAGAQDRLSWMIQLPAVLSAEPKRALPGGEVVLYVAGARADVDLWSLRCIGAETVETAPGSVRTVKFMRTPRNPRDTLAEVWLDPMRHYLPVRARLTQGGNEDDAFELVLRELKTGP